ncbi:hypothetical protein C8P63_10977 [Melghirimyces profundicolus]|uniref:Prenyltransferase/squalene oxidase-like repeat protein n=1 Tax=Melghirimyces profundicolus TaxID=1242148 RepID=A0A2T6BW75_9BACL|nr:hypothetical protein [Melghirimyces profundicolus]PTX60313.1 hypothetical protein C8P63_10977 [Melghirimyces profundicolus]
MMRKLSAKPFSKARDFLLTRARPLDRAMFRFEFEQGSAADVLKELESYQNEDGGFGHALEPDFRLPDSSALASTIALQYISRLRRTETPPMVQRVMNYLRKTFDEPNQIWMPVPQSIDQYPRATDSGRPFTGSALLSHPPYFRGRKPGLSHLSPS